MRVISRRRLREFWRARRADAEAAERDLSAWYKTTRNASWPNFAALRQTFGSADQVGNCVVFDVGNNRLRLIGRVNDARQIVYVLKVMDHREYDKGTWVEDCGCHKPPPRAPASSPKAPTARPARRGRRGGT
ncbi:MAG TPA: type II toxin-antitoxin system HigB family toxin [Isosphaeraceae bacterium]|nr:type II toxin-antitoxin system HigB family toxin [Isosphaeraceae bacterium]